MLSLVVPGHAKALAVRAEPVEDVGEAVEGKDSGWKGGHRSCMPTECERDLRYPRAPHPVTRSTAPPSSHCHEK